MDPNKLQPDYVGIRPKIQNRNGRLGRHLGGPRRAKKAFPKGVPKWGRKSDRKGGFQNESFWDCKNLKKRCQVLQNPGFEGSGKVSKI